ncbi:pilus assembly protein [Sinomonas sp. ASV486]|uniref:pilus assembly protein n=1 Tax=Sinomonas sp. ASV486 TaxID=3051170 RepID=UPI0027DDE3A1|nr:pilus assembly protein [Sinomonas sp. ASV486]MDQ4488800.1 pilus assembly protein [Sinomonas sp. ASV486]
MIRGACADGERGAIAILSVVLMLALIGVGAVAVDLGQVYAERAQLQNGADSAAIAIGQQCYKNQTCTSSYAGAWTTAAQPLVNGNANDNASTIQSVTFPVVNGLQEVVVTTSTRDGASGAGFLTPLFAKALNVAPATVGAQATVSLKPPGNGGGFPLAFSNSCFDLQSGQKAGNIMQLEWKPGMTCTGPSGTAIPGGWGWLLQSGPCQATTTSGGNYIPTDPGNGVNRLTPCQSILQGWIDTINAGGQVNVIFPVFDQAIAQGAGGQFHILGYATLRIYGWHFANAGSPYEFHDTVADLTALGINPLYACSAGVDRCVIAQFVRFDTVDPSTGTGSGNDLGTTVVTLIK